MDQSVQTNLTKTERKIYSGTAARILKLLGNGCLPVEAAKACGVSEGLVSQLQAEPDFVEQVNELVAQTFAHQSVIDSNYTEIEKNLSKKLLDLSQYMMNPDQVLRTLKFANEAKRKIPAAFNPESSGSNDSMKPVMLVLPGAVVNNFVLNPNNEIVAVDGKELTTLPSANLKPLVEKYHREQAAKPAILEKKSNGSGQVDPYSNL